MNKFLEAILNIYRIVELRERIILTLGMLLVYRIGAQVVLPGIDPVQLSIFSNLFMSVAEQMGRTLQRTAISTNIKEHEGVIAAAMTFVAQTKAEAKFGNTQLPLWIVYGQGGGAHYYGIKDTYIETQTKDMLNNPEVKKLDQAYGVIRIEKAGKSKSSYGEGGHNVTEMYLMSGIDDKQSMPLYLLLNLTTVSGSRFSMKAEVEKELPKKWI